MDALSRPAFFFITLQTERSIARAAAAGRAYWCSNEFLEFLKYEKDYAMTLPKELKPALLGAVGGAVVAATVGFASGSWITSSTAKMQANEAASKAVTAALAPVCLDNFQQGADAIAQKAALKKEDWWNQAEFVEKRGWASIPGIASPGRDLSRACAELIVADEKAAK